MSTESTTRCEYCANVDESVSTRTGRGSQALCDTCDAWITERMREMTVEVPDSVTAEDRGGAVDPAAGRTLALDPELGVADALEFSTGISYEAIGQLEAAGFETVDDLWTADRDELLAVPYIGPEEVESIVESISTQPIRGFEDVLDDIPDLTRPESDEFCGDDSDEPTDDDAELL